MNELDALVKSMSQLLLKYVKSGAKVKVFCDNVAVVRWVQNGLSDIPMQSTADNWPLVQRRVTIILEIIELFNLAFEIEYISTHANLADKLTRYDLKTVSTVATVGALMAEEAFCPVPVTLRWWKSLREGERIQSELIKRVHDEMAHPSISQAMATLGRYFEISDCRSECLALSAACSICHKKQARLPKEFPNFAMSQAVSFGDTLQMDSVVIDQQYYYSIVDTASRFAYLFPSRDRPTGVQTREVLSAWVAFTGVLPRIIRADNGPEFAVYLSQWADERGVLVRHVL